MPHDQVFDAAMLREAKLESIVASTKNVSGPGRPAAPRPTEPNLVSSWRTLHGELELSALDDLNDALGTSYTLSRVAEWERGSRQPNSAATNYMLADVLPDLLREAGVPEAEVSDLVARVTLPAAKH
ncbi:conserved hypothetical protein [Marinobacter salarius]|nr:conserved hypothetical protein [Marinobacter salarius]